mgnify:CR=1 FL=1
MSTTTEALRLARVPIVDRGIGWQADATATLKMQAAQIDMLLADVMMLKKRLEEFTPLPARGVVDADDNLDCWDTAPFELCAQHVAALNEKDPAAMWRVVELFARDLGPND